MTTRFEETRDSDKKVFEIVLRDSYFPDSVQLRIISTPKPKYQHWRWRILEFLTFGKRFNSGWEYTCERVERSGKLF